MLARMLSVATKRSATALAICSTRRPTTSYACGAATKYLHHDVTSATTNHHHKLQAYSVKPGLLRLCPNKGVLSSQFHTGVGVESSNESHHDDGPKQSRLIASAAFICGGALLWAYFQKEKASCKDFKLTYEPGSVLKKLPTYTTEDVKKHNSPQSRIWVTYKNGVYDVTDFVSSHPGGDKILLAAGGSLEPYFALYGVHKTKEVMEMVESMRIGNIMDSKPIKIQDAFKDDPDRSSALIVNAAKPFNAEPPEKLLLDDYITPNPLFFVRNHMPVPVVTEKVLKNYTLEPRVDMQASQPRHLKSLSLAQIRKLPQDNLTVTLQCAGNRRKEMSKVKEVKGLSWNCGSISTAEFKGARLIDVIRAMGYTDDDLKKHKYVQFEGLDIDPSGVPYGSSIATEKAMDENHCVMVAYEMNGEPIPSDHGFPLRVIIPGVVGARNVKWLKSIVLSNEESRSHWQRRDYKCFNPSIDMSNCDFDGAASVTETPVQSAICEPSVDATVAADEEITVKGYAYSGGGRGIVRVDLSLDGGKTWINPELNTNDQSPYKSWAWTIWEATVPLPKDHKGKVEIVCKAVDSSHNVQPENVEGIWNHRGLLNNSWHRVTVNVK